MQCLAVDRLAISKDIPICASNTMLNVWITNQRLNVSKYQKGINNNNLVRIPLCKWGIPRLANINARSLVPKIDELSTILSVWKIGLAGT